MKKRNGSRKRPEQTTGKRKAPPARPCPPPTAPLAGCGKGTIEFRPLGGRFWMGTCGDCGRTVGLG